MIKLHPLTNKRLLFVLPQFELGGAERQALFLASHLKSLGCDVQAWGLSGHSGRVVKLFNEAGISCTIHYFRWPCRTRSLVRVGLGLLKLLRHLRRESIDVILPYTTWANVGTGLIWRLSSAKLCIWGQRDIDCLRGDPVERFAYRRVSAIICNAKHEIDYLQKTLGKTRAPISVIPNGLKLAPNLKTSQQWRTKLGVCDNTLVVTMLANFRPEKDHATLLYAWHRLLKQYPAGKVQPRLLLAGAAQESFKGIQQLSDTLNLKDSVIFLGHVKDISGLLSTSDIGVLTTEYEGLPNAVLEYMASGLPVVATDLPSTREALGDTFQHQFCTPGDPDSLCECLKMFLDHPELRRCIGHRNQHRTETIFSVEKMCQKTVDTICDLLEEPF